MPSVLAADNPLTRDRFATGKTWQDYLDSGIRNRDLFERNYSGLVISPAQDTRLKALAARPDGPNHVAVIGEDWCPDVYRGAGIAARIAEAMGIEFRFFERDKNKELIQPYLNKGEFESIPVFVFFDRDHRELFHFIERPQIASDELHLATDAIGNVTPEYLATQLGHEPSEEEIAAARAAGRQRYLDWQTGPDWARWRVATVDEVIEKLEAALA